MITKTRTTEDIRKTPFTKDETARFNKLYDEGKLDECRKMVMVEKVEKVEIAETLAELPADVQADIKETALWYDSVHVFFEYGRYDVSPHTTLKAKYGWDHTYVGTFTQKDFTYTEQELKEHRDAVNRMDWEYFGC